MKADDLLTQLTQTAEREVESRNAELPAADRRRIAEAIAIAAVRYFLVKFSRGKVIVFDIDEALSFEGETGPYIQYAAVRANNILAKLARARRRRRTGGRGTPRDARARSDRAGR